MPADLTIFAAKYLVFIDALLPAIVLVVVLYRRPHADVIRWIVAIVITAVLAFIFARIGAALYHDPRPFTQDHVKPLITHAADNGFPSDHGLLAAVIVAAILLAAPTWSLPFVVLAVLVDWARVGAGIHHVADVIGSSLFVALATVIAILVAPALTRLLLPHVPSSWSREEMRLQKGS